MLESSVLLFFFIFSVFLKIVEENFFFFPLSDTLFIFFLLNKDMTTWMLFN